MAFTSMNIGKIASDIAQVWGFPAFSNVPPFGQERIRIDINMAIQQMQDCGEDFYGREEIEVTLVAGTSEYELANSVQSVLDPVKLLDETPLRKLTTRGQMLYYGQLFKNRLNNDVPDGPPEAYFVETLRETSDSEDNVRTIMHFLPAPTSGDLANKPVVPVIKVANLFSAAQLTAGTATLPVAHRYIESILLPLARYNATTCFLFYKGESMPKYETDYLRALQLLGAADPRRQQPKPPDSNTAAMQISRQQPQQPRNTS